jgi:YD repeat-containing protein
MSSMTAGTTAGYLYQRGPAGLRTNATELSGRSVTWNYDGIQRLTSEAVANDPLHGNGSATYALDPVGNRSSSTSSLPHTSSGTFGFNLDDQLTGETYDNNGNVTMTGGNTFSYDSRNRLVSFNNGAVSMVYDGVGNRVAKTANGVTTRYLVDDLTPPACLRWSRRRLTEPRPASTPTACNASTRIRSSTTPGRRATTATTAWAPSVN